MTLVDPLGSGCFENSQEYWQGLPALRRVSAVGQAIDLDWIKNFLQVHEREHGKDCLEQLVIDGTTCSLHKKDLRSLSKKVIVQGKKVRFFLHSELALNTAAQIRRL